MQIYGAAIVAHTGELIDCCGEVDEDTIHILANEELTWIGVDDNSDKDRDWMIIDGGQYIGANTLDDFQAALHELGY